MLDNSSISSGRPSSRAALGRKFGFHNWKMARVRRKPASYMADAIERAPDGKMYLSYITKGNRRVFRSKQDRTATGISASSAVRCRRRASRVRYAPAGTNLSLGLRTPSSMGRPLLGIPAGFVATPVRDRWLNSSIPYRPIEQADLSCSVGATDATGAHGEGRWDKASGETRTPKSEKESRDLAPDFGFEILTSRLDPGAEHMKKLGQPLRLGRPCWSGDQ